MNKRKKIILSLIVFGIAVVSGLPVQADEESEIFIPIDAVQLEGTIYEIFPEENGSGGIIIDDIRYHFSPETTFLTSLKGSRTTTDFFHRGQFVGLVARKSDLLSLWPEKNPDSENDSTRREQKASNSSELGKRTGPYLKDGVWVN